MFAVKIDSAIETVIAETVANGGSSQSLIGKPVPDSGYMVGGYVDSLIFDEDLLTHGTVAYNMIERWVNQQFAFATRFDVFLGGWIDTETHLFYADLSLHFDSLDEALVAAKENEEIAIWDLGKSEEIRVA